MATQSGSDGIIDVPANSGTVAFVETPTGAVATAAGPTTGVRGAVANDGQLTATGGSFNNSQWALGNNSTLNFRNTALNNSSVIGAGGSNNLNFAQPPSPQAPAATEFRGSLPRPRPVPVPRPGVTTTSSSNVVAELRGGSDSISFANRSSNRTPDLNLGQGRDSITFARGSNTNSTSVDLGTDNDSDSVVIDRLNDVRRVVINNFGATDTLKIGGRTFNAADIERVNGKFGRDNLTVNLD
jgi:hypothetical protein